MNSGCIITSCERISIGNGCAFGTNVSIYDHDHTYVKNGNQPWDKTKTAPIIIGNNVWIGCNVIILRGSIIGDNCVVAAGSIIKGIYAPSTLIYQKLQIQTKNID